jgi:MOB kinase activator 1
MSNFITTMFVHASSNPYPSFPAKPEPLPAIFTFVESQSCMNLRMDLDILDYQERGMAGDAWSGKQGLASELAKPKQIYQGPLQRIGQALRRPPAKSDEPTSASPRIPQTESRLWVGSESPKREISNDFYKILPSGRTPPIVSEQDDHAALDSVQYAGSDHTGSIIGPASKEPNERPRNKGYFASTGLLSSFFSNPRTRGPFKPQKSNRGTSSWQLKQYAEATLGSGSLRKAVKLPEGEDKDEWLAVNGEEHGGYNGESANMGWQWSTSTTRSIFSMAPSPSSALRRVVQR